MTDDAAACHIVVYFVFVFFKMDDLRLPARSAYLLTGKSSSTVKNRKKSDTEGKGLVVGVVRCLF